MNFWNLILEKISGNFISILTFILTPICSALVVYFQIRKSHIYWRKQQGFLREIEIEKLRILTYRETVELTNQFNDAILNHHIYASNRDIAIALSVLLKSKFPEDAKHFYDQYRIHRGKAEDSYLNVRNLSIKFSGLGVNIKVYFSQELFNLYSQLQVAFKTAQLAIYSEQEVVEMLKNDIQKQPLWTTAQNNITENYNKKIDEIRPIHAADIFLTRLMKDFEKLNDA